MMKGLIITAIRRKRIVYTLFAVLIALGIYGLANMNRDEFPAFQINQGLVAAIYPGASASEMENQVTKPLEEALLSFAEVDRSTLKSYSKDGKCYIYADLISPQTKKDEVWSKIKLKLDFVKKTLPTGVLAVVVLDDFSQLSSVLIAMESDDKGYTEMNYYADDLCDRLRTIPELANVTVLGKQDEEIAVNLDMGRLTTYGISPASLLLQYQTSAFNTTSGEFKTDYSVSPIHIANTITGEQEVEDKIVYTDLDGNSLRLKDVATVERRYKDPSSFITYNGNTTLIVNVTMRGDNNIVKFGKKVDKVLAEFSAASPESIKLSRITDQPKVVSTSIRSFLRDLAISMLVVIFVMLMLFPMKSALIAGSGVPVCTAVTLAIMYMCGFQLNTVTLAALIVVLGMIVDDAIITMDGYMAHLGAGMGRKRAAVESGKELILPMLMSTTAISLMLFPIKFLITGYIGVFVQDFPWVMAVALCTSLVYAIFVVPSLEVKYIKAATPAKSNFISRGQNRFFSGMQNLYGKGEVYCFKHPAVPLGAGVMAMVLGLLMFSQLNVQMMPKANRDCFAVEIFMDSNASLDKTQAVTDSLRKLMLADKRIKSVTAFVGESAPRFQITYAPSLPAPNVAQLIVNTTSNRATEQVLPIFQEKYEHWFPDALIHVRQMDYQGSLPVAVILRGAPPDTLKPYADSIRSFMYGLNDKLHFVNSDCDNFLPTVNVALDPDEATRLGVNKSVLSLSLAGAFSGQTIASIWEGDRKVPVNLYSAGVTDDMDYGAIGGQYVPTLIPGLTVPLREVAKITPQWQYEQLPRYGAEESISIYADTRFGDSQPEVMRSIKKFISKNIEPDLPEGVSVKYAGLSSANKDFIPEVAMSFAAAVGILFLFLLFTFKKMSVAFLALVLSMLCLFGASFGLWAFGMDFSITAVLGLISLVGIIVRNGIVMFELAEKLRASGHSVKEAAFLAGQRRMRPIFLTSCTSALGVLPMIISGDLLWMPMGLTICFGTMLSIILVVFIMPVSYWQLFKGADKKLDNETI